jgi:hypothetical protein
MWSAICDSYRGGWRFALAMPLLFLVPVLAEIAQHLAEYHAGMFASLTGMKAAADDPGRMAVGQVKVLVLALMHYVVVRYLAFGPGAATKVDRASARSYAPVFAVAVAGQILFFALPPLLGALGLPHSTLGRVGIGVALLLFVVDFLLTPWKAAGAVVDTRIRVATSARLVLRRPVFTFVVMVAAVVPLMALHYGLNFLAVGRPPALGGSLLLLDGGVSALLGAVMMAASWAVYRSLVSGAGLPIAGDERPVAEDRLAPAGLG